MALDTPENFERKCNCGQVLLLTQPPPHAPVNYDPVYNEFRLTHQGRDFRLLYCFACGGKLPDSLRGRRFTIPSESDSAEVAALLPRCRSAADVLHELGPSDIEDPWDSRHDWPPSPRPWRRQFSYTRRWKTLVLIVIEYADDSLSFGINGQPMSDE